MLGLFVGVRSCELWHGLRLRVGGGEKKGK